jgi:rod shape-determining protein MreD
MGGDFRLSPVLTLACALALTALPLPASIAPFKPSWAVIAVIYWSLAAPRSLSFISVLLAGLLLDALTGALLGQHALALLISAYISRKFHLQLRSFPVSQLVLVVAVLLALYQFVLFWIDGVADRTVPMVESWAPVASGAVVFVFIWSAFDRGYERASSRL